MEQEVYLESVIAAVTDYYQSWFPESHVRRLQKLPLRTTLGAKLRPELSVLVENLNPRRRFPAPLLENQNLFCPRIYCYSTGFSEGRIPRSFFACMRKYVWLLCACLNVRIYVRECINYAVCLLQMQINLTNAVLVNGAAHGRIGKK